MEDEDAAQSPAVIMLRSPSSPAEAHALCEHAAALLAAGGCPQLVCELSGRSDLRTVDVLAQLAVLTVRAHSRLVLRVAPGTSQHLEQLFALAGLGCLGLLRSEPSGQPEPGEE